MYYVRCTVYSKPLTLYTPFHSFVYSIPTVRRRTSNMQSCERYRKFWGGPPSTLTFTPNLTRIGWGQTSRHSLPTSQVIGSSLKWAKRNDLEKVYGKSNKSVCYCDWLLLSVLWWILGTKWLNFGDIWFLTLRTTLYFSSIITCSFRSGLCCFARQTIA